MRRIQLLICLSLAAALLIPFGEQPDHSELASPAVGIALALLSLSASATLRYVRRYISAADHVRVAAASDARVQGVSLATNTLRHLLGNKLAVTVGRTELLADDPRLPADLRQHARTILASAMAAADTIRNLESVRGEARIDESLAGPPVLDLDSPTAPSACERGEHHSASFTLPLPGRD